jgi:hypothetical protein
MIPCCYHPTRVVFVNVREDLVAGIHENIPNTHMTFQSFEDSQTALHYMNDIFQSEPFYERYKLDSGHPAGDPSAQTRGLKTDVLDMHHEIYRPQRFDEISTVVYDYTVGSSGEIATETTSLDFLESVENPHIQKILLIGPQDHQFATDALSKGLIHHFVRKDNESWEESLYVLLREAQWSYFTKLSEVFMKSIRPGIMKEYAFDDPNFQKLFKTILTNHGFTEAYLCESTGSYLFLDSHAQDHGLVVNIPEQLDKWVRTGKNKGINLPLLKALIDRTKMMCYQTILQGTEPDKSHWDLYAHPANAIKGQASTYYYAFAPNIYDIDVERILPFEEYRGNQERKGTCVQ